MQPVDRQRFEYRQGDLRHATGRVSGRGAANGVLFLDEPRAALSTEVLGEVGCDTIRDEPRRLGRPTAWPGSQRRTVPRRAVPPRPLPAASRRRGRLHPLLGRSRQAVRRAGLRPLRARLAHRHLDQALRAVERGIPRGHRGHRDVRVWVSARLGALFDVAAPLDWPTLERLRLGFASTIPNWQTPGGVRSHHESNSALGARGDPRRRGHHSAGPGTMDPWDRLDPGGSPGGAWRGICFPEWATRKVVSVQADDRSRFDVVTFAAPRSLWHGAWQPSVPNSLA